jgi:diaminopimelate epimerase
MTVKFYKYQGTGNDFVMIDNRPNHPFTKKHTALVRHLCDRKFGIGADGLILLNDKPGFDFEMVYFNNDGNESTMCGNGGRCLIKFAHDLGVINKSCSFLAIDGPHEGAILDGGVISLKMKDVISMEHYNGNDVILNTGSPHYVKFVDNAAGTDIVKEAKSIRYSDRFSREGINVNFVERISDDEIFVRTYERGVEDETLSCGTGVVASSLAFADKNANSIDKVKVKTLGGNLEVRFTVSGNGYEDIYLIGPAEKVFEGTIEAELSL